MRTRSVEPGIGEGNVLAGSGQAIDRPPQPAQRHLRHVQHFRGAARPHSEALALGVIDPHIRVLVRAFNVPGRIESPSSCEGHGFLAWYSSPYLAFRCRTAIAAVLASSLEGDALSRRPRLYFHWSVEPRFNRQGQIVFNLSILNRKYYRYVNRRRLDSDFSILASMMKETLDAVVDEVAVS
jgi:hypothetical protein